MSQSAGNNGVVLSFLGLSVVVGVFAGLNMLFESSSYVQYIDQHKKYFNALNEAFAKSNSYEEFVRLFKY